MWELSSNILEAGTVALCQKRQPWAISVNFGFGIIGSFMLFNIKIKIKIIKLCGDPEIVW